MNATEAPNTTRKEALENLACELAAESRKAAEEGRLVESATLLSVKDRLRAAMGRMEHKTRPNVLDDDTREQMEVCWNTMGNPNLEKLAAGLVNTHPLILNNIAYSVLSAVSTHAAHDGRIQPSVKEAAGRFFERQYLVNIASDIKVILRWKDTTPQEQGQGILRAISERKTYLAEHTRIELDRDITLKAIRNVATRLAEGKSEDTELDLGTILDYCEDWI